MNMTNYKPVRTLIGVAVAAALAAACASTPKHPLGSEAVRAKLTQLQADATLAGRAPVAIKDAEVAVHVAEMQEKDLALAAHRVYIADRKVDTARALAQTSAAEAERLTLNQASEKARLDSRTHEVDLAKSNAMMAKTDADAARLAAGASQEQAALAQEQAAELQRQVTLLQARPTDRGLVLTLGDTLFATGKSDLKSGATANLSRITAFMNEYPKRTATIEGFTDSMGADDYNQDLSQRRADSVRRFLIGQGVGSERLNSSGRGESSPVADNESAAGRQQNRRVEVIISPVE